ncbi:MAG: hypothetical protein E6G92_12930 [Alphaproteobacteria bacterium]|nr:MAG: hypothetical protein E6G92_12930 [Alphaproteobacteria bacterium]
MSRSPVIPAKAGIPLFFFALFAPSREKGKSMGSREGAKVAKEEFEGRWIPAFAGMTERGWQ